ncbi:MAG: alkaline phosphatase family protein [Planctomycetes bacterium]|nr:alkaline phosphatase family protein [Planctomycetota bacterium]
MSGLADTRALGKGSLARRDFPPLAERVLIIGLDGATFDVLGPLMDEGLMPRLQEAVARGAVGALQSTVPPITPAAWTTFMTGKQPASHGIIDFERLDFATNRLLMNSTRCLEHVRSLWQILSDKGLRVGSVNVPMTFPPTKVNGFMVSGFETPSPDSDFVFPRDLREEILARWPDPVLGTRWRRKWLGNDRLFADNVAYMARSFQQGAEVTTWLGDKMGWDALMVVLKLVDNLQHKTWRYLDPRWADRNPVRRDIVKNCFHAADSAVGTLLDYAQAHNATVFIVSDHGHGSLEGKIQPNLLLQRWGYLALRGRTTRGWTRALRIWNRWSGSTLPTSWSCDLARDLAVDFSRTRACVMHAGMAGFLYINLQGRQSTGIVKEADYEPLREELRTRFLGKECRVRDRSGQLIPLFSEVHKPEELYGCSREDHPWLPDLILTPRESLAVIRKIRGRRPVRWLSYRKLEGTHRPNGVFVATGPGIARKTDVAAHIVDCTPTILAALGLRIPDDMEGRVLTEVFERPPTVETEAAAVGDRSSTEEAYSPADLREVTARLSDLGYLE